MFDDAIQTYTAVKYNEETKQHYYASLTYLGYTLEQANKEEMLSYSIHTIKDPNLTHEQLLLTAYIEVLSGYEEGCDFLVHVDQDDYFVRYGIENYIIRGFDIPNDENYFLWNRLKKICELYEIHCCWLHPFIDKVIDKMPYLLEFNDFSHEDDPLTIWMDLYGFMNYNESKEKKNAKRRKKPDPEKFTKRLF